MDIAAMQALHAELWQFRNEMQDVWPTPDTLDSLRFAFTEAGEAMDAYLRTKGRYARNHVKEPDVFGELADCAMMLMTALGPKFRYWADDGYLFEAMTPRPHNEALDEICYYVSRTFYACSCRSQDRTIEGRAKTALAFIVGYPGMDLPTELHKRMDRIRAKHGKQS